MKIAVVGCAHGELDQIYEAIEDVEQEQNTKIDLLLCCGDFQAVRNQNDLQCMVRPKKYLSMCTFYKYYSGEKTAPILTIFIGGNHEASNYLQELLYGGWVAPNIYYLGRAGVVNFKGIRIGGLSGIYKTYSFYENHSEYPPYDESTKRSIYHYRQEDVHRLKQLGDGIDIMMSHDWPDMAHNYGDTDELCTLKPHFCEDINNNSLGSPACWNLLTHLKPKYWFSGHLHCRFVAVIPHENQTETKFLALDKCQSFRKFLEVIDVDAAENASNELHYDLEWLAILSLTKHLNSVRPVPNFKPDSGRYISRSFVVQVHQVSKFKPTAIEKKMILQRFNNNLAIPKGFVATAAAYDPDNPIPDDAQHQPALCANPQTIILCDLLGIDNPLDMANKLVDV